jgi:hypothetical protein
VEWVRVEKKSWFGWHTDTTVPLVRLRSLAFAQVAPMKTQAGDHEGVSQWTLAPYGTDGIWKRKLVGALSPPVAIAFPSLFRLTAEFACFSGAPE